jgi:hypothetical protein
MGSGYRGKSAGGFSLVELMVALLLLQIGLLGVAGMVFSAQENLRRAEGILRGTLTAILVGDSVMARGLEGRGSVDREWGRVIWVSGEVLSEGTGVWVLDREGADTMVHLRLWAGPGEGGSLAPPGEGTAEVPLEGPVDR